MSDLTREATIANQRAGRAGITSTKRRDDRMMRFPQVVAPTKHVYNTRAKPKDLRISCPRTGGSCPKTI